LGHGVVPLHKLLSGLWLKKQKSVPLSESAWEVNNFLLLFVGVIQLLTGKISFIMSCWWNMICQRASEVTVVRQRSVWWELAFLWLSTQRTRLPLQVSCWYC